MARASCTIALTREFDLSPFNLSLNLLNSSLVLVNTQGDVRDGHLEFGHRLVVGVKLGYSLRLKVVHFGPGLEKFDLHRLAKQS